MDPCFIVIIVLSGHSKIDKALNDKWWLNEGRKYCRILPLEHPAILLTCIKRQLVLKTIFCVVRVAVLDRFYCSS